MEIYIVTFASHGDEFYTETHAFANKEDAQIFFDTNVDDVCSDYCTERGKHCEGDTFTFENGKAYRITMEKIQVE